MKRFLSAFFIFMCLVCGGLLYGCGDRYANLSLSIEISYDGAKSVEDLPSGDKRVILNNGGAFDDHLDGSYTFYIVSETNTKTTATVQAKFSGVPDDFNYEVSHSLSTEILSVSENATYIDSGVKKEVTANCKGRTELTLLNVESGKKDKIIIDVVEVASSMSFIDKSLAIVGSEGSTLTLNNEIVKLAPSTSTLTNVSFSMGELDREGNFEAWDNSELVANGLRFNRETNVLSVFDKNLKMKSFYIMASYDNPVGDNLTAITEVRVVNALTDFKIYAGVSVNDAKEENLIAEGDINDLIVNIEGLSDKDIILKVKSNGEEINFGYTMTSSMPVYFPNNRTFRAEYFQADGVTASIFDEETKSYYKNATYALCFIKICAGTKTTLNDRYPSGTYPVEFVCDYENFKVDNYPLKTNYIVKNDNLITSFAVNGEVQNNFSILQDNKQRPYDSEVYLNSSANVNGTSFNIDVGNTDSILQSNKKFTLALYKEIGNNRYEEVTGRLSQFFSVKRGTGQSGNLTNVIDNFASVYDCNTTFYFVPNALLNNVHLGDVFYLIVTAEKPYEREDKQAKATIKLNVVQGINEFPSFNYEYSQFEVDEATGNYVQDPVTGENVVKHFSGEMPFKEDKISEESLNLDLSSGLGAVVTLKYLPEGASLNNITVLSSNEKVLSIERFKDEKNSFKINLHSVGQEEILIRVSHLDVTYKIKVNVYTPITNFNIRLGSTSVASGIGKYKENNQGDIISSTVQVRKEIYLNLTTTPPTSTQFRIDYFAYYNGEENNLLGHYYIDFDGKASSVINVIGDADFAFICARGGNKNSCSFNFPTDTSVGRNYTIVIKVTNLNGLIITKSFELESYVPIKTIKTDVTRRLVYNPNTISFYSKTEDALDPTVFGLKIDVLAENKDSKVTYGFDNYGRIILIVNNIQETFFVCSNGRLEESKNTINLLTLISQYPDGDGYYWFKLNSEYNFGNVVNSVFYSIQIQQLDMWFTQTNSFRVADAERVSTLVTYTDEQLYYKQGFSQNDIVDIQVLKDTTYNKNLLVKVYDLIETPNGNFYYDLQDNKEQNISCVTNATIEEGKTSSQFNLNLTPSIAGRSVIVIMPEDKIITQQDYNNFTQKEYVKVDVTKENFAEGIYFIREGIGYVPAPQEFDASLTYYAHTTVLKNTLSLWKYCLVFYMSVADGVKVPYHIASYDDLKEVSLNSDSVTKRYVFTKNVTVETSENWKAIGNYYLVEDVTIENFKDNTFYINNNGNYEIADSYSDAETYYLYGFNGEISGKYSYHNVKTDKIIETFYKLAGLSFEGTDDVEENLSSVSGFISNLGNKGRALNLNVSYGVFRPTLKKEYTFGGIAANNYGYIENSITSFDNITVTTSNKAVVGGVVGENKGTILNNVETNIGVKGIVRVVALNKDVNVSVGGLVGVNRGKVYGSFKYAEVNSQKFVFNDAGFNSTLNIIAELDAAGSNILEKSSIGGAVGTNYGLLKDVSIKGTISAPNFNNVGGLVGSAEYNKDFNNNTTLDETTETETPDENVTEETETDIIKYSIDSSYSIASVTGYNNVGGAIGVAKGANITDTLNINYTSAENYATNANYVRVFVNGKNNVGGLIGNASNTNIQYSYVVSYFECMPLNEAEEEEIGYDIVGINAGGFIGLTQNTTIIKNSASFVNVKAEQVADLFIHTYNAEPSISDVFVIGYALAGTEMTHSITQLGSNIEGYFYYIAVQKSIDNNPDSDILYIRDTNSVASNTTAETIIQSFGTKDGWYIDSEENSGDTNSGLPILTISFKVDENTTYTEALFATTPINVSATTKEDENQFITYIKNDDNSLIIFYNYDYLSKYLAEDINKLNIVDFQKFIDLEVYPLTGKSKRLDIATNNSKVISIDEYGNLRIMGEGKVTLTISSKLNSKFKAEVYIVVKYGVRNVNVYKDVSSNVTLDSCKGDNKIVVLKNRTQSLFVDVEYTRDLDHEIGAQLKPSSEVGIRFEVSTTDSNLIDILEDLKEVGTATDINGLFKINGATWMLDKDGKNWYVEISSGINPIITPLVAMENNRFLRINYVPYIKSIFNAVESTIILDRFAGDFDLSIIKGATGILIENNLDSTTSVEISQLETHTFTVTLFTDYEADDILDNFVSQNENGKLTIVKSDIKRKYTDDTKKTLESISATFTISYKDKLNAVENDLTYLFKFSAASNGLISKELKFVIVSQDKINQVYGTMYSAIKDFPQSPNKNAVIYNGKVGVLSVEVYPYFSNYNSMRVYYRTQSSFPLLITQLSYDITGETGQYLTNYPDSGSIQDMSDVMQVEKSSGQDSYLLNPDGIYSYSKVYFFSLLAGTNVPDRTNFTFYVDFLRRDGTIIETFAYNFVSVVQPKVEFNFNDELYSKENKNYYLPLNTKQSLDVNLVNYEGEINWEVSSVDYNLTQNEIETLTPYLTEDGNYEMKVFNYEGKNSTKNVLSTEAIGKHITLTAIIVDNENTYTFSQTFVVTMFTVTGVTAQNVERGYMTIPMSTTTPLLVNLDIEYDEALIKNPEDNWYQNWFEIYGKEASNELYRYIYEYSGYEIEEFFSRYLIQLSNAIAKASYNYNDTQVAKTSGVWFYDSGDETSGYLQVNRDYNGSTFGVEQYNEYIAVYGYQIDRNSKMSLRTNISYSNNDPRNSITTGIPNVHNYSIAMTDTTFETAFSFKDDFILNFVYKSDLINAIPVSTPEEFLTMQEGFDYRLVNDIELAGYMPISTPIASFDGNNHKIYITSFGYAPEYDENCVLGLFDTISENTMLYNVSVHFTNRVSVNNDGVTLTPSQASLNVTQLYVKTLTFGGIAATNNGVLTNCKVSGRLNLTINNDINVGPIPEALNGGLVARNTETAYITNSSVVGFDLSTYGITAGFVGENNGKVVSSFFNESSITNLSSSVTAGFVYSNQSNIYECYTQGYRTANDNDIRNTGNGIQAEGNVGGFVYSNNGNISDCYSNISLKTSSMLAGFVYTESSSSIISRCYSISYKSSSDNSRIASPFAGANSSDYSSITINGQLNYCYYLTGDTWTKTSWASTSENKQAKELSLDEFSTHTNFVSYDLSLVYNDTQTYADGIEKYSYVDGYTWVIIEGKPVIVSTLIRTISQRNYYGKSKNYKETYDYFVRDNTKNITAVSTENLGGNRVKTVYTYEGNSEDIVYTEVKDFSRSTITYFFPKEKNNTKYNDAITIVFELTNEGKRGKALSAEYGTDKIVVLDVRQQVNQEWIEDSNFRANDTIEIYTEASNDNSVDSKIVKIVYKVLENASYYYGSNAHKISDLVGTRTNPQIIYDYESFVYYMQDGKNGTSGSAGKHFRIIKDIDFVNNHGYLLPDTVYSNFQGALQGNYMALNQISISYVNNLSGSEVDYDKEAFGVFGSISTIPDNKLFNTVISNLTLNVVEVLSNTHERVGALAGKIHTDKTKTDTKVILNNITVGGMGSRTAHIQGKNAAGGLAGIILGDVIIKDINVSANVNATRDVSSGNVGSVLYNKNGSFTDIAYAGGVVGILDCNSIVDASTQRNYNASNIHFSGSVHITGGVVGGAFGLVGKESVVNYANVDVANTANNYLEASVYAGGLVGENRGIIRSSSVSYRELENYSSVKIGSSNLIDNLFFRSSAGSDSVIASGGLVGLNNGGLVSNSISTVDVRDANTRIAGGAVGRMIVGTLKNVIATGSLMSKSIIGGLIGTANNSTLVTEAGYNEDTIATKRVTEEPTLIDKQAENTVIIDCVAANNWLIDDYWQYEYLQMNNNAIAGFIGLISNSATKQDFIIFEGTSFYTNTLYTASNASTPQKHLKVAYFSNTIDIMADSSSTVKSVLTNKEGTQAVFPYSIREAFYEDTNMGVTYTMYERENPNYKDPETTFVKNTYYSPSIYELRSYNLENPEDFYTKIDFNDPYWEDNNFVWESANIPTTFDEYVQHFGIIYALELDKDGKKRFNRITTENAFNLYKDGDPSLPEEERVKGDIYYIRSNRISTFRKTTSYLTGTSNDIILSTQNGGAENKRNDFTFNSFDDLKAVNNLYINGLLITDIGTPVTEGGLDDEWYKATYNNVNYILPNNTKIVKITFNSTLKEFKVPNSDSIIRAWEVTSIDITYDYDTSKNFISVKSKNVSALNYSYSLQLSSKQVIYNKFIDNGYWSAGENFLLDASYDKADKYLTNLEFADIYLWTSFASEKWYDEQYVTGKLEISTPEEFAMFANMVNEGTTFAGKTVKLVNDIDLSGKFWVPIGSKEHAFKGTFDAGIYSGEDYSGENYKIKYATVNSVSNSGVNSLGGIFGYVENATIKNLETVGGDIYGTISGGVVAMSNGSITLLNVENRNNVTGEQIAGGIIGKIQSENVSNASIVIENCINHGDIDHQNTNYSKDAEISLGGIIGSVDSNATGRVFNELYNDGTIIAINNRTSYSGSQIKIELNVGGIIGNVSQDGDRYNELNNYGNIDITTNAHTLNVGGVIGITKKQAVITHSKNYASINISYNNIYSEGRNKIYKSTAMVGGVIGRAQHTIISCGNEGKIEFNLGASSSAFIGIGGAVGTTVADVQKSYNANNIEVYTITRATKVVIGGVVGGVEITSQNREVSNCYNSGDVQATSSSKMFAGGIVGSSYVKNHYTSVYDEYSFYSADPHNYRLTVKTNLNVGYINVIELKTLDNGLGAIAGYGNFDMVFVDNFYLRDSAFSGNTIYKAYCLLNNDENAENKGYYTVDGNSNYPKLMVSLKNPEEYTSNWSFVSETNPNGVWQQYYDTWYPSLRENNSSSMWSDKLEEVSQEHGSFIVKSGEELAYLANVINSGEIDSSNITIKLTSFIDLSNRYWIPIGTKENTFKGKFDGNGYVIRNLTIDGNYTEQNSYGGLFGYCEDATITEIGLENTIIKNVEYAGAVAYNVVESEISRIYTAVEDEIKDAIISAKIGAGGLVYNLLNSSPKDSNNNKAGLYYSYNDTKVETVGEDIEEGTASGRELITGGIVGRLDGSLISNSYNNSNADLKTEKITGTTGVGSGVFIAGRAYGESSIINVFNLATNYTTATDTFTFEPRLYHIVNAGENNQDILENSNEDNKGIPTFENLKGKSEDNSLSDIWTQENEYTLNKPVGNIYYPSIRGLGGSWKNTESEALVSIKSDDARVEIPKYLEQYNSDIKNKKTLISLLEETESSTQQNKNKTYYFVTSEEELAWISTNVNSGSLLTNRTEFVLMTDLDLSGKYWTPIGSTSVYPFQGVFNMNGHRIKGITIDNKNLLYGGLFGYTNNAKIVNGYIEDAFIKIISESDQANVYAGAVVGRGYNTTIQNVSITTAISVTTNSAIFVGGAIGSLTGTTNYVTEEPNYKLENVVVNKSISKKSGTDSSISDSYPKYIDISKYYYQVVEVPITEGTIQTSDNTKIGIGAFSEGGNVYVGGIVGYASGYRRDDGSDKDGKDNPTINGAVSDVNIAAITISSSSRSYAGGIVGFGQGEVIMDSVKSMGISKTFTNQYDCVGGIAGYLNDSDITNAYFGGYIEPCQDMNNLIISRAGGIVGFVESTGTLNYCYSKGSINHNPKYENNAHIGAIIGYTRGRDFNGDSYLIYDSQGDLVAGNTNFTKAVGYDENNNQDRDPSLPVLFDQNTGLINNSNGFLSHIWSGTSLNTNFISVKSNDDSVILVNADNIAINANLSNGCQLVRDYTTITIKSSDEATQNGGKLQVAGRNEYGEYVIVEATITQSGEFLINGYVSGTGANKINFAKTSVILVSIIPNLPDTPVGP